MLTMKPVGQKVGELHEVWATNWTTESDNQTSVSEIVQALDAVRDKIKIALGSLEYNCQLGGRFLQLAPRLKLSYVSPSSPLSVALQIDQYTTLLSSLVQTGAPCGSGSTRLA